MAELADALVVANAALGNSPVGKLPPSLCCRSSSHKIFASKSFAGAPCLSILSPALAGYLLVIFSNLILSICGYGGIGRRARRGKRRFGQFARRQIATVALLPLLFPQNLCKQIFCGSPLFIYSKSCACRLFACYFFKLNTFYLRIWRNWQTRRT